MCTGQPGLGRVVDRFATHLLVVAAVVAVADGLPVVCAGEVEHGARLPVDELVYLSLLQGHVEL